MIYYSGVNLVKRSNDRFIIDCVEKNLKNFYLTFDSIYLLQVDKLLKYDFESNNFKKLDLKFEKILISSNTNYLYCLIQNESNIRLIQFVGDRLIKEIRLSLNDNESCYFDDLMMTSSDINLYIFENKNGLKCRFELKREQDKDSKSIETEKQLNENSISSLPLNTILIDENIKQIEAGKEHCLLLTNQGQVYSFGLGTKGQLGHDEIENCYEPKLIKSLKSIVSIACGGWSSGCLNDKNEIFLWGWNESNQLGLPDHECAFFPSPTIINVKNLITDKNIKFKKLSLGARHSGLIDLDYNLYTFGWNKYSQLFQSETENESEYDEPSKVFDFERKITDLKCGCWFTLISTI